MENRILRCGFAGSGFAAKFHYESMLRVFSVKVEFSGVYSTHKEHSEQFAVPRNMKSFDSIDELIDHSDVVHVCTPPYSHEPIVIKALKKDRHVIVEKPLTGYFGNGSKDFSGDTFPRSEGLKETLKSIDRMLDAEKKSKGKIMYAENYIYAPAIIKEKEILEKTKAQILRITGECSHSGSHAPSYGIWKLSGGGSMIGKGCHPLSAALYLKQIEGMVCNGKPIRPATVSGHTHAITRMKNFRDEGNLRATYTDIEDFALMHIVFEDGTFADISACELVLGGVKNHIEVFANNHRTICNINPNNAMQTYTPDPKYFNDVYIVEKTETKAGWSSVSPDEGWFTGYRHEMEAFYRSAAYGDPIESNSTLAADTIATIYAGYLSAEKKGAETEIPLL